MFLRFESRILLAGFIVAGVLLGISHPLGDSQRIPGGRVSLLAFQAGYILMAALLAAAGLGALRAMVRFPAARNPYAVLLVLVSALATACSLAFGYIFFF